MLLTISPSTYIHADTPIQIPTIRQQFMSLPNGFISLSCFSFTIVKNGGYFSILFQWNNKKLCNPQIQLNTI